MLLNGANVDPDPAEEDTALSGCCRLVGQDVEMIQ